MLLTESSEMLRFALFSGFTGFVIFCACFASQVWWRRNIGVGSAVSWVARLRSIALVAGVIGLGVSWAMTYSAKRSGIVDGKDLFVVHARPDSDVSMTARADVGPGDVVAVFHPPGLDAQLSVLDSEIKEAQERIDALAVRPVEIDPLLVQQYSQLRTQVDHQQQLQLEFMRAQREVEAHKMQTDFSFGRERNEIENKIAIEKTTLGALPAQLRIAQLQFNRADELRRNALVTAQAVEDRTSAVLALRLQSSKVESSIAGLTERLALLTSQQGSAISLLDQQLAVVSRDADAATQSIKELHAQLADVERRVELDRARAWMLRDREESAARQQRDTRVAERARAVASSEMRAPFAGRVIYRSASPGLAQDGAPILAVSTGAGFQAKILMPASEVSSVAAAGDVTFLLEHSILKRYFAGRFLSAEPAPFQSGYVIAHFDAQLPSDAIGLLGNVREPLNVRLLAQPPLLMSPGIDVSLLVIALAVILTGINVLRRGPTADRLPKQRAPYLLTLNDKPSEQTLLT
jgi:hypothetical protein